MSYRGGDAAAAAAVAADDDGDDDDDDDDEMSVSLVENPGVPGGNHRPIYGKLLVAAQQIITEQIA